MALPSSGQLSLKDIGVELGITAGNQASLRSMSSTAGKSTPDSVSDFYGYSSGFSFTYGYSNSITTIRNTTKYIDFYQPLTINSRQSGYTYTYSFTAQFFQGNYAPTAEIYRSIDSTSSWSSIWGPYTSPRTDSTFFTAGDYNDTVRIRMRLQHTIAPFGSNYASLQCALTNLGYTTPSGGTGSGSGTTVWTITLGIEDL